VSPTTSSATGAQVYAAPLEWALGAAVIVAVAVLNLRGLPGSWLGDDFSHFNIIAQTDREGRLSEWLLGNFVRPLDNGNFAYRPILFLSYALDWRLWGANAIGGHLVNLVLHLANSLLVGCLAIRWASRRRATAGIVSAAVFAAYPFAGEVSFWVAGRSDLLAVLFGLLFLLSLTGFHGKRTAYVTTLRVILLLLALLSKESAVPLPLVATLLLVVRTPEERGGSVRKHPLIARSIAVVRELFPIWTAFAAYLAWRLWLFGTPLSVYPTSRLPSGLWDYFDRLALLRALGQQHPGLPWPALWPILFMLLLAGLVVSWASARPSKASGAVIVGFVIAAAIYILSPSLSLPYAAGTNGEGARNYYFAWIFVSTAIGLLALESRLALAVSLVLTAWMLVGQEGSTRQWQEAARLMRVVTNAVPAVAREIGPDRYAALLLPDHLGVALFARNAQGGIVMRPTQQVDYLDRLAGMLDTDIDHWRKLIAGGGLDGVHGRHLETGAFAGVFCLGQDLRIVQIDQGGTMPGRDWARSLLKQAAAAGCVLTR
jgi:hypothetical protein